MPTLSLFFGIIITMYQESGGQHNIPHFHARYQDDETVISTDGEILEEEIPKRQLKLVLAWAEIHKEELEANWYLLSKG